MTPEERAVLVEVRKEGYLEGYRRGFEECREKAAEFCQLKAAVHDKAGDSVSKSLAESYAVRIRTLQPTEE